MTREEAIKICTREKDCVQGALDACADGGHYVSPDGIITALDYVEALDMAISAMREQGGSFQNGNDHNTVKDWPSYMDLPRKQEERSQGCSACEMTTRGLTYKQIEYGTLRGDFINDSSGMYIIRYGGGPHSIVCDDDGAEIDIEFCPLCGRRLEEV